MWNEANLDSNEVERIERGPRMKIDEPKTPYQQPRSHRSPEALQLDGGGSGGGSGSEPVSPVSTNGSGAGAPPSDLNLGDRIMDISNQALQRREHEWSDDDDNDEQSESSKHGTSSAAAASSSSHALSRHAPSAIETSMSSDGGASSGADTPEKKHAVFEAKKKANYSHMVRATAQPTRPAAIPSACSQPHPTAASLCSACLLLCLLCA